MATLQLLTYRITLDTTKNGIQRILQGWVTGENLARRIEVSLASGHDTYELPLEGLTASMYVTTPTTHTLSINACEIDYENNKIIYDVLDSDISEAGLVNLQLKIFDNEKILISPSFQLEVWESTISDSQAVLSPTFSALTAALAQAEAYAEKAISQVYIDEDYTFVIEFADGTEYTSSALKDCLADCEAERLKAEGWAVGKQDGEDVASDSPYYQNNAEYYSGQANGYKNMAENAKNYAYGYANDALGYKNDASGYADTASAYADAAGDYVDDAHDEYLSARSYAVGDTGTRTGEEDDNAKHYKEVCEQIAASLEGGFIPMGTITFESLPTENVESGWMYNISNDFTTDSRFKDGSGKHYPAGTNVYFTGDSMWDCLSASYQTAKGTSYDNTPSGLTATDVQDAIDELADDLDGKVDKVTGKGLSTNDYTDADKAKVDSIDLTSETVTGNPLSFTADSAQPSQNTVITFEPIQSGSGDPSPSNVRAISGYSDIEIGVPRTNLAELRSNLFTGFNASVTINTNGFTVKATGSYYPRAWYSLKKLKGLGNFYVSYTLGGTASGKQVRVYDSVTNTIIKDLGSGDASHETVNIDNAIAPTLLVYNSASPSGVVDSTTILSDLIITTDAEATYEPYNPLTDITLELDSTIYGGTLDVESGELTVDKKGVDLGTLSWTLQSDYNVGQAYAYIPDKASGSDFICSKYKNGGNAGAGLHDGEITGSNSSYGDSIHAIWVRDSSITASTASGYATAMSGVIVAYKLATPLTYHLTPHQVRLLQGANVVTSNGTSLSLTYRNGEVAKLEDLDGLAESINNIQTFSDEKLVDKTDIAYVEKGTNASRSYSVGELVYVGGTLCRVATAISSGSAFTVGTNIVATTIGAEISKSTGGTLTFYASFSHYTVYNTYRANIYGYFKGLTATLTKVTVYNSGGGTSDITSACTLLRSNDYELELTTANSVSDLYAAIQVTLS